MVAGVRHNLVGIQILQLAWRGRTIPHRMLDSSPWSNDYGWMSISECDNPVSGSQNLSASLRGCMHLVTHHIP